MDTKTYLASLYAKPCECVRCGCDGGYIFEPFYYTDEIEVCMDCYGSGLTEVCDRCMDIEEVERDMEFVC